MSEITNSNSTAAAVTTEGSTNSAPAAAFTSTSGNASTTNTGSAVAEPWYRTFLKYDGSIDANALNSAPDHVKGVHSFIAKYKTADDFAVGIQNLQSLASRKALEKLPDNASKEQIEEQNKILRKINGAPEKPSDYGIKRPENVPPEQWNDAYINGALDIMHKFNAPPEMVKQLVAYNMQTSEGQMKQQQEAEKAFFADQNKQAAAMLVKDGMSAEKGMELAARTARQLGIDPENDPEFKSAKTIYAFAKVAQMIGEPKLVTGEGQNLVGSADPAALAHDVRTNKANPLYAEYYAGNKGVLAKVLGWENEARMKAKAGAR